MKTFVMWNISVLLVFALLSGGYHFMLSAAPRKILVAVDSSFEMQAVWARIPQLLDTLDNQRYATFSLVTEKNKVQGWTSTLNLGTLVPYAPPDYSKLIGENPFPEVQEAAQKYLITTNADAARQFKGWTVMVLRP